MSEVIPGSCLCGSVRLKATLASREADICHCDMCRKWAGGILVMVACEGIEVTADDDLGTYRASAWGERGFCTKCGSSLFWRMQDGSHHSVAFGVLDDVSGFRLVKEIFIDEKPDCYSFAEDTVKLTAAETVAAFTNGQDQ